MYIPGNLLQCSKLIPPNYLFHLGRLYRYPPTQDTAA